MNLTDSVEIDNLLEEKRFSFVGGKMSYQQQIDRQFKIMMASPSVYLSPLPAPKTQAAQTRRKEDAVATAEAAERKKQL